MTHKISDTFPAYSSFDPHIPVRCVTPTIPASIHRYFDSSPFSPSGRFLLSTQLPYEDRLPTPGDKATLWRTDLETGEQTAVAETLGWDTQVGAHAHWGISDNIILFNELAPDSWRPFGVRLNTETGERKEFEGPIYSVARNGEFAIAPNLTRTGLVQAGYGMIMPSEAIRSYDDVPADDGVFRVDLETGEKRLIASLQDISEVVKSGFDGPKAEKGKLLGFHLALNPQADRVLIIVRWVRKPSKIRRIMHATHKQVTFPIRYAAVKLGFERVRRFFRVPAKVFNTLVTMRTDGSDMRVALPARTYAAGGHHPNWTPDGRSILMNLVEDGVMRFVKIDIETGERRVLNRQLIGSGHPTLHADGNHILTDAYPFESVAYGDGTVPLRWANITNGRETPLIRIGAKAAYVGPKLEMRVDPHPAWNHEFTRFAFNGYADGTRRVYVADATSLTDQDNRLP